MTFEVGGNYDPNSRDATPFVIREMDCMALAMVAVSKAVSKHADQSTFDESSGVGRTWAFVVDGLNLVVLPFEKQGFLAARNP